MQKRVEGRKRPLTIFSDSEMRAWRECHALWGFRYPMGLAPLREPAYFIHGRIVHKCTEAGYKAWRNAIRHQQLGSDKAWSTHASAETMARWVKGVSVKAIPEAIAAALKSADEKCGGNAEWLEEVHEEIVGIETLANFLIPRFWDMRRADFAHYVPLLIEYAFDVRIRDSGGRRTGTTLTGRLDLALLDRDTGQLAVSDIKTTIGDPWQYERRLPLDPQTTGYVYALRELLSEGALDDELAAVGYDLDQGPPAVGPCLTDVLSKKVPVPTRILKDGTVTSSESGTANTPWEWYEKALKDTGEPEWLRDAARGTSEKKAETAAARWDSMQLKQATRLSELKAMREKWIHRFEHHRTGAELERWRAEVMVEAKRMRDAEHRPVLRTRNPSHCSGPGGRRCQFWDLCLDPGNEELASGLFTTREQRAERKKAASAAEARTPVPDDVPLVSEMERPPQQTSPVDDDWDLF